MNGIQVHSATDLITNSSTIIYTYSKSSIPVCKELIDEILRLLGEEKKCDDVFVLSTLAEDYTYQEFLDDDDEDHPKKRGQPKSSSEVDIPKLMDDIMHGLIKKPKWMKDAEEKENYMGLPPSTNLCIVAKDPKYETLAELVVKFLGSADQEAVREG